MQLFTVKYLFQYDSQLMKNASLLPALYFCCAVLLFVENFSYTSVKRDFTELPKQGELLQ